MEGKAHGHPQAYRHYITQSCETEEAASELRRIDLQPGQEEQEGQSQQGEDLEWQVNLDPTQTGRAHGDTGEDQQHRSRNLDRRHQADKQRCPEGDERNDEETVKGDVRHVAP